jgi:RNA polymerase sigma-70 factor (ECF subfamily)
MVNDAADIASQIPRLRRYARALTGDTAAADDLVQDTLERAWRRLALWRSGSDMRAWLFTIMHNIFVNQLKANSHGRTRTTELAAGEFRATAPLEDRIMLRDLHKALDSLSPEQKEVLLLIGLEQMSYGEAAKVLGIPVGTVMSRLSRGREQLRAITSPAGGATQLKVVK